MIATYRRTLALVALILMLTIGFGCLITGIVATARDADTGWGIALTVFGMMFSTSSIITVIRIVRSRRRAP